MTQAIGMIEVEGVAGIIVAADAACKAAAVKLAGWESIGGFTTLFVRGEVSDIEASLLAGTAAAATVSGHVVHNSLLQPEAVIDAFIGVPVDPGDPSATAEALGIVETRGYGLHVESNDRMVKEADVTLIHVLTVHDRVVCSLVAGELGAVERAIEGARQVLSGNEWFMGSAVLSQPEACVVSAFGQRRQAGGN